MTKLLKKTACTLLALLLLTGLVPAAQAEESSQEVQQMPALTGMFVATELVTHDNPWTQEDWNHAVRQLKDAGMDKIVLQYAVQYYSESYKVYYYTPSFEDPGENVNNRQQTIEYALNACRDNGVQLWLGLHLAEDMWFSSMSAGFRDVGEDGKSEFLTTSAEFSKKVFDDLWAQYGAEYGGVIGGWYLPYEFNNTVGETARTRLVQDFYAPLTEHMKQVTPDKQIMVSPLIYPPMLTEPTQEMLNTWEMLCYDVWANSRVDIIAPQDGCGWESSVRENLPPYYEAMVRAKEAAQTERDRKGWGRAVAWNNPELYSMTGSNTMTMQRFGANMQTLDQYVEEHVSFSLHSLVYFDDLTKAGTNPTNRAFYEAYLRMVQQGGLTQPEQPIPAPSGLSAAVENEFDAALSWERLELEDPALPVAGYQIRREDVNDPEAGAILLRDVPQPAEGEQTVTTVDAQLEPGHTYRYSVYAYDGAGNLSGQPAVTEVTIDSTAVALKTVSAKQTVSPLAVSAYGLDNAPLVSGDLSALTAGGADVRFALPEGESSVRYVLQLDNQSEQPVSFVYLNVKYSPAEGLYFPQKIEVLADGVPVNTLYPQQEYGTSMVGDVRVAISLNGATAAEKLELVITQNQQYLALAGLQASAPAAGLQMPDDYTAPANLAAGLPVVISGYAATQNFDPNASFRGTDRLVLDYGAGLITTETNLYKGGYATDLLTRGSEDLPFVSWQADGGSCRIPGKAADADRSVWLRTVGLGSSFDLTVELEAPQTIQGVSTEWLSDRDAAVFLPVYIEYYGMTQAGVEQLIGVAKRPNEAQIDFTRPAAQDNCHRPETFRYKAADTGETVYTKIIARVYVQYPANSHFVRAFSVY